MEHLGDSAVPYSGSLLVGTVQGSIKLIAQIPQVKIKEFSLSDE